MILKLKLFQHNNYIFETSKVIADNKRTTEDLAMFKKFCQILLLNSYVRYIVILKKVIVNKDKYVFFLY